MKKYQFSGSVSSQPQPCQWTTEATNDAVDSVVMMMSDVALHEAVVVVVVDVLCHCLPN